METFIILMIIIVIGVAIFAAVMNDIEHELYVETMRKTPWGLETLWAINNDQPQEVFDAIDKEYGK